MKMDELLQDLKARESEARLGGGTSRKEMEDIEAGFFELARVSDLF